MIPLQRGLNCLYRPWAVELYVPWLEMVPWSMLHPIAVEHNWDSPSLLLRWVVKFQRDELVCWCGCRGEAISGVF